ncbi:hypothetical protein DFJ58DRAFT_719998 [Suillus subalutaceus]|uniref:uncharacterized protein n=1 Tax=Suillus subalutaceus TaxID=48586 RepID=UPI001B87B1C1|nr:uncharacterized protein DFJ58DRAFT_719998 [Suillus subalutaceus]KAG1825232.1 hypothetical protein DFJ58DRAFT_719998 [Suillus subalutaceus]
MEYWQKLINLAASQCVLENFEKDLQVVQDLESKLGVAQCWVPDTPEWEDAGRLIAKRKYQRALDALEGLVVARIFELTKLNRSGTAICSALDHYNAAALSLTPPCRTLKWDEVIEYAFLSDFDLLRDACQDISQHPWEHYLHNCYTQLEFSCPALAHQISLRRLVRSRANRYLLQCMADIARLQEFSRSINIGESIKKSLVDSASIPHAQIPAGLNVLLKTVLNPDMQDELEDEEEDVPAIKEAAQALHDVLHVSVDS